MGRALRLILPAAVLLAVVAPPAAAAPRAQTAAQQHAQAVLEEASDLREGRGVRTGRELTEALRELTLSIRHLRGDDRAEAAALLSRPSVPGATVCAGDFCVHGTPAGILTASLVLEEAQRVHDFETGTLGWRPPPSDGTAGGDSRVDIYLEDVGAEQLFGYAQTDGTNTQSQPAFLVIDDDFSAEQFGSIPALDSLRVTLAHEYGHVLQYGYDVTADGWHYESSATWLEHRMYPELDDWLRFVRDGSRGSGWASLTEVPLTAFDDERDQPRNAKPYGTVVWNFFLADRYGDALQRRTWELSDGLNAPSTHAYDTAIKAGNGGGLGPDFAAFAAAVAEWQTSTSGFPRTGQLPEVERRGVLTTDGAAVAPTMDHLTFALYDVAPTSAPRIRLAASFPAGTRGALALVGREGSAADGQVTTRLVELPDGGVGGVTLENPQAFTAAGGRVTAVLVNADASEFGYGTSDWSWARDNQRVAAAVTTDFDGPTVARRSPAPGARRVRTAAKVRVTFAERVSGVNNRSFVLTGPGRKGVPAAVSYDAGSRTATLTPAARLRDSTRYTARLTGAIVDGSAAALTPVKWSFRTRSTPPRANLSVLSRSGGELLFRLQSRDADRLRFVAQLVQRGRTVARKRGRVRPSGSRFVTLRAARAGRGRLVVRLEDPQGNTKRIKRSLRLPG